MSRRVGTARTRPREPLRAIRGRARRVQEAASHGTREPHWIIRDVVTVAVLGLLFTGIQLGVDNQRSDREQRLESLRFVREHSELNEDLLKPFGGLDLRGMNLSLLRLSKADFAASNLSKAQFVGADIQHGSFDNVAAKEANFSRVYLWQSGFVSFRAEKANFAEAVLVDAKIEDAILVEANMDRANLEGAFLKNVDLTAARGLETANLNGVFAMTRALSGLRDSFPHPRPFLFIPAYAG